MYRHRAVFRRTPSPCRDAPVSRLDRRHVSDTCVGLADRWLGQLRALATATYTRHFHLRPKVGLTASLAHYCMWGDGGDEHKDPTEPTKRGPQKLLNNKICSRFFRTGFRYSARSLYSGSLVRDLGVMSLIITVVEDRVSRGPPTCYQRHWFVHVHFCETWSMKHVLCRYFQLFKRESWLKR